MTSFRLSFNRICEYSTFVSYKLWRRASNYHSIEIVSIRLSVEQKISSRQSESSKHLYHSSTSSAIDIEFLISLDPLSILRTILPFFNPSPIQSRQSLVSKEWGFSPLHLYSSCFFSSRPPCRQVILNSHSW